MVRIPPWPKPFICSTRIFKGYKCTAFQLWTLWTTKWFLLFSMYQFEEIWTPEFLWARSQNNSLCIWIFYNKVIVLIDGRAWIIQVSKDSGLMTIVLLKLWRPFNSWLEWSQGAERHLRTITRRRKRGRTPNKCFFKSHSTKDQLLNKSRTISRFFPCFCTLVVTTFDMWLWQFLLII